MSDIHLDPRINPQGEQQTRYGGFWVRVLAYMIDALIVGIAFIPLSFFDPDLQFDPNATEAEQIKALMPDDNTIMIVVALQLLGIIASWLYFALMQSSRHQATVGKMALGLKVVDNYGNRIGFGRATGRFFAKFLSLLILYIGFIMVAFTDRKRGLHDMLAGTLVVKS